METKEIQQQMEHIETALHSIIKYNENRDWMQTPFTINNNVYSTNAYSVIKVPKESVGFFDGCKEERNRKTVLNLFDFTPEKIMKINVQDLKHKLLDLFDVIHWVAVNDDLPKPLETVWLSNGKGWTNLGCLIETNEGYHWAESNGVVYQDKSEIVAECESDDLEVVYWCKLPKPPCL